MTLIKSISGIRGTIGGREGDGLTPLDVVKFTSSFCHLIQQRNARRRIRVVVGRDARISGPMVSAMVCNTLVAMGAEVIDLGLSTTPTVEIAVPAENADAGIILTASHNPGQWNALKLLNGRGEFISAEDGQEVLRIASAGQLTYAPVDELGSIRSADYLKRHIDEILNLALVDRNAVAKSGLKVAVDAVNSSGGIFIPALLKALGVDNVFTIHCEPNGQFPHNPEPLPEHLGDLAAVVREKNCDMGIVVDPDVDRLAFVCEDGSMFGEEYTLVAVADYVLSKSPGNTVSNLSSTRALRDVTRKHGGEYRASAVGEVNVVSLMKESNATIGGEGNGGIIYPEAHYGRDALTGLALFLTHFVSKGMKMTELRDSYPTYTISKNKIELDAGVDIDSILKEIEGMFPEAEVNTVDGVKFDFPDGWVHLRKSNTEPIVRVIAEHHTRSKADELAGKVMDAFTRLASANA